MTNTELRRKDDKRMDAIERKFEKFQDQYVKNGKELIRMSDTIITMAKEINNFKKDFKKEFKEHKTKTEPMIVWFSNINFAKRTIMWILGIVATIGGILLTFKEVFK